MGIDREIAILEGKLAEVDKRFSMENQQSRENRRSYDTAEETLDVTTSKETRRDSGMSINTSTEDIQIANMKVGEFVECDWPVLLNYNTSGFLEMRCQGDAQESSGMQEPFALVTVPESKV